MLTEDSRKSETIWYIRLVLKGVFSLLFIVAFMFLLAGRITYWQGWVFSGICLITVFVSFIMFSGKKDLARERVKPGPGTKWWDWVFYALYIPSFLAVVVIAPLDAGRFNWTGQLHVSVYIIGYIIYLISHVIIFRAMWVNRFFSSTVRIQMDRNQEVVQDGPYSYVRHPGYVAGILMGISMALILGSLRALIPAGVVTLLLIVRTCLEDVTLRGELTGYSDYAEKVRYRLLPGIW